MLYLAWDREINISLFFCDVFVWKWGPRPQTSSRCYHGNKSAAPFKKSIFVHPPWAPNCMQNLKGGWKFSFPKMFDSFRDLFLRFETNTCSEKVTLSRKRCLNIMSKTRQIVPEQMIPGLPHHFRSLSALHFRSVMNDKKFILVVNCLEMSVSSSCFLEAWVMICRILSFFFPLNASFKWIKKFFYSWTFKY